MAGAHDRPENGQSTAIPTIRMACSLTDCGDRNPRRCLTISMLLGGPWSVRRPRPTVGTIRRLYGGHWPRSRVACRPIRPLSRCDRSLAIIPVTAAGWWQRNGDQAMYIGVGTLVVILLVVLIIYVIRRA